MFIKNKILQPYLEAASEPDWFPALKGLIEATKFSDLRRIKETVQTELKQLGFVVPIGQKYLNRIIKPSIA